eukprot:7882571-Pyramimonas_sp.AAC.3
MSCPGVHGPSCWRDSRKSLGLLLSAPPPPPLRALLRPPAPAAHLAQLRSCSDTRCTEGASDFTTPALRRTTAAATMPKAPKRQHAQHEDESRAMAMLEAEGMPESPWANDVIRKPSGVLRSA